MNPTVSDEAQRLLSDVATDTNTIRTHQDSISRISDLRREKIVRLRELRITYREIAAAMHVTEQSVYKVLRDHIADSKQHRAQ